MADQIVLLTGSEAARTLLAGKVIGDVAGAMSLFLAYLGDQTGVFIVQLKDPQQAAEVSEAVDATFKNSLAETLTADDAVVEAERRGDLVGLEAELREQRAPVLERILLGRSLGGPTSFLHQSLLFTVSSPLR